MTAIKFLRGRDHILVVFNKPLPGLECRPAPQIFKKGTQYCSERHRILLAHKMLSPFQTDNRFHFINESIMGIRLLNFISRCPKIIASKRKECILSPSWQYLMLILPYKLFQNILLLPPWQWWKPAWLRSRASSRCCVYTAVRVQVGSGNHDTWKVKQGYQEVLFD